jgi:hypothetical protein
MASTTNYNWDTPDNSGLVKNGAQDIRTLGSAIDTSVWNVGFGQSGKNKIINGDFAINQRNFSSVTSSQYTFDRWNFVPNDGTVTCSVQQFTAGAAPVAGYEGKQYARLVTASQTAAGAYTIFEQRIENVRTFAGQTMTMSFWAKAATGTPKVALEITQNFGSGGSPSSVARVYGGQVTLSTSWARYSITYAIPSISGKTVGTTDNTSALVLSLWTSAGTDFNARTGSIGIQNNTVEFWGVQAEYGSKATPFQTASGGSPQAELAMCQRYYVRFDNDSVNAIHGIGLAYDTTNTYFSNQLPVTMRTRPSALDFSALRVSDGVSATNITSASIALSDRNQPLIQFVVASGLTAFRPYLLQQQSTSGYYGLSAEL